MKSLSAFGAAKETTINSNAAYLGKKLPITEISEENTQGAGSIFLKKQLSPYKNKSNIANILIGTSFYSSINWLIDYPIYAYLIYKFGAIYGGSLVILVALIFDTFMVKLYTWSQNDWLLLELIKTNRNYTGKSMYRRIIAKLFNAPKLIQIALLSLKTYPPVVVFLMRDKAYDYSKMTAKDWSVFFISSFISNTYWVLVISIGVAFGKQLVS